MIRDDDRGRDTIARRARKNNPCPVCQSASKGCSVTSDGLHLCRGEASEGWRELSQSPDSAGFRHYRRQDDTDYRHRPTPSPATAPPAPARDWTAEAERYARELDADAASNLAAALGIPADTLAALPLIGVSESGPTGRTYTLPECDGTGLIIGLSRRLPDGRKLHMAGGRRGLTLPADWRTRTEPLYLVEGPSDTLAMAAAGLRAIGRPSNTGGADHLLTALRDLPTDAKIVVVGENDKKDSGQWPGRDGADSIARQLADGLRRPILVALAPDGAKDVRAWLTADARESADWADRGAALAHALLSHAETVAPAERATEQPATTPTQKPTTAKILVEIARTEAELWRNDRQRGYATIGRRSLPIRATQFRQWLTSRYRKISGGHVANSDAIANAITAIEAEAVCDGPTYDAYTRVARHNGRIYLHLADEPDTVIEIGPDYWRECENPPVRFRRSPNAKPLPMPKRGGSLDPLRRLLNMESDSQFALVVGWLCGALRGAGPYPTLVITGSHGSGKSTAENTIKRLIDPTAGGLRSQPREERDLMVAANNSHVLAFDNFSALPDWLSDSFCRLATGGGLSTRGLYTDDDEVVFEAVKPTILNGINDFVSRPDLLDRAILLHLPTIPDDRRRTEDAYWADFGAVHPLLLGAILDRLAHGLARLDTTDLAALPRMADFARFAVACESEAESGQFLRAFSENENAANEQAIENSSLALAIVDLLATRDSWEGTPTDLLAVLAERSRLAATARDWPKTASVLSGKLTRLAPSLRKSRQIEIAKGHCGTGDKRNRTVRLSRIRDGDGTALGRRGTAWDGDPAQTPSQSFALKKSGKDAVGTPWDGRDGVSPPSTGAPSRRLYGAVNAAGQAKGGPAA